MSSLLFLSTEDFKAFPSEHGTTIGNEIKGFSLILFYSTQCCYCQRLIPIFKKLPEVINGCHFAMINVSMNKSLIQMARSSTTPITYVPLIILYINGRPYMRYDGPAEEDDIRRFIFEMSNTIQEQGFAKTVKEKGIPAYTIGNPLVGESGRFYLDYEEAYDK